MEVSDQPHAPAASFPPSPLPIEQETGWDLEPVCTVWRKVQSLAPARIWISDCPAGSL